MYKKCAICYKPIGMYKRDALCSSCYKRWGKSVAWVKALIKIERRNDYLYWVEKELGIYEVEYFDDPFDILNEERYRKAM